MIRIYRYRIYPSKRQQQMLNQQLAICCELYNAAIQERRDAWARERKSISWFDQNGQMKEIRQDRDDVASVNSQVLQDALRRVDLSFRGFFRRIKAHERPGYPRYRSTQRYDSLTFRQNGFAVNGHKLRLSKVGQVRIKLHRPIGDSIKRVVIKREAARWYAIFSCEFERVPLSFSPNMVGVDVGLTSFATLSDGTKIKNPRWFRAAQAKLRRLQRRVARRQRRSNRRRKAALLLQRFHNHVRDQRRDFHHKESRKLINANGLIAVEDLNIKGLARGHCAKSVNDAGWSNFIRMLTYKAEDAGRLLVKVDPRGTSQTCLCGAEVRKTLGMRVHRCLSCGLIADRDHVSAQLILAKALPSGVNVAEVIASVA